MTIEERLHQLEKAVAVLRRAMESRPNRKFKAGDAVLVVGKVIEVDMMDNKLPYRVEVASDAKLVDWLTEDCLVAQESP